MSPKEREKMEKHMILMGEYLEEIKKQMHETIDLHKIEKDTGVIDHERRRDLTVRSGRLRDQVLSMGSVYDE